MALTAEQRARLPANAYVYPRTRTYPVPTKTQGQRAGISERQRIATARNALSRAAQSNTSGSYRTVARKVAARTNITSVKGKRR